MSGSYLHLVLRGIVFEGDRWTFCFLLVLTIYDIRSLHSGKVQHFFLNHPELQKSMPDQILSGDLAGPGRNCGNTMVAQSVGILLMWYLQSWTWPLKAAQWEAVLSILWKLPSPAAAGRSPVCWKLVWLWKFEMSTCPWTCLRLLASEFVALKSMEMHPKLSLPAQDEEGSQHGVGGRGQPHAGEERLCGSCPRLCTKSKDLWTDAVLATFFLLAGHQFADIVPRQQEVN